MLKIIAVLAVVSFIGGCVSPSIQPLNPENQIICSEPRPQVCTREYRPVCANKRNDIECITIPCPSVDQVTYATGCTACADPKVISYLPEACPS